MAEETQVTEDVVTDLDKINESNVQQENELIQNNNSWILETNDVKSDVESDVEKPLVQEPLQEVVAEQLKEAEIPIELKPNLEIDEELALKFLAEKKGVSIDDFKELLTPKEEKKFAPEMEAFDKFIKETGNSNYSDFQETQKDWSVVSNEEKVKKWIELTNPKLTKEQREFLYEDEYSIEDLDADDDSREIMKRQIKLERDSETSDLFFEQRKKDFSVVRGSDDYVPIEYREAKKQVDDLNSQNEAVKEIRTDFVSKTESFFSNDFKGFEVEVGNETDGFATIVIKPENVKEIKDFQKDSNNLITEFIDKETGKIKDIEKYHLAMYMAKNYRSELNKARMQGRAEQIVIMDKLSKNIQPDNPSVVTNANTQGAVWTKE